MGFSASRYEENEDDGPPGGADSNLVNILIVDDVPAKLLSYQTVLEELNQNVITARSGEEALKLVLKYEFAVILLDVNMPGLDGFETASLIRGRKKSSKTPIIFLTAFTDEINSAQGYASGAVDYLPTPVVPEVLRAKVKVFIELFIMRQQAAIQAEERAKREAAEESDRKKDEFLAMLAHELRNPLAPIRNALSLLQLPHVKPEIVIETYQMMDRQLHHMIRLVDDLMDVSRITTGKVELNLENVALLEAIEIALEASEPYIKERNHKLVLEIPNKDILVYADVVHLAQVFSNLLNNAAKYTEAGGQIYLNVSQKDQMVSVSVRDNGIGIPTEKLNEIFGLFMQIDNSIHRAQGGLGIGLTVAKNLVEMQGGIITVESVSGQGSNFTVTFQEVVHGQKAVRDKYPGTISQNSYNILVVDDNKDSAQTLGWMLEMLGHTIYLEHNGPDAIASAKAYKPDIVFLDIGMPGMSGYEICHALKADPALINSVFIAQTGWGQQKHRQMSSEAGFDFHLVKPILNDNLMTIMAEISFAKIYKQT